MFFNHVLSSYRTALDVHHHYHILFPDHFFFMRLSVTDILCAMHISQIFFKIMCCFLIYLFIYWLPALLNPFMWYCLSGRFFPALSWKIRAYSVGFIYCSIHYIYPYTTIDEYINYLNTDIFFWLKCGLKKKAGVWKILSYTGSLMTYRNHRNYC